MEKQNLLSAVWRHWWVVLVLAVGGAVLGALPSPAKVEEQAIRYTATHTLLVNDEAANSGSSSVSPSQVSFFASVGEVPKRVAEKISYSGSPAELATQVIVNFDNSNLPDIEDPTATTDLVVQDQDAVDTFVEDDYYYDENP